MAEDLVLTILKEMRAEAGASREETRSNFATVFHRINLVETNVKDLRTDLTDVRTEASAFREETRANFTTVFHRLGLLDTQIKDVRERLISLEKHMAALLLSVPVLNERLDHLESRLAAVEARLT